MDEYTRGTRAWLDERFRLVDADGVYHAHQPIYGFRAGHSEPGLLDRYVRTYQIMQALAHLRCQSLLDVGAAEGYKAYVAQQLRGVQALSVDLSPEACRRAREIFGLGAAAADICRLPFAAGAFDVVLCSETLEHVPAWRDATAELLRVARTAVVITVPHEPTLAIDADGPGEPHAHLHRLDLASFDYVAKEYGVRVLRQKLLGSLLHVPRLVLEADARPHFARRGARRLFATAYYAAFPALRRLLGARAAAALIALDQPAARFSATFDAMLFVLLKEPAAWLTRPALPVSSLRLVRSTMPYYYPDPRQRPAQ